MILHSRLYDFTFMEIKPAPSHPWGCREIISLLGFCDSLVLELWEDGTAALQRSWCVTVVDTCCRFNGSSHYMYLYIFLGTIPLRFRSVAWAVIFIKTSKPIRELPSHPECMTETKLFSLPALSTSWMFFSVSLHIFSGSISTCLNHLHWPLLPILCTAAFRGRHSQSSASIKLSPPLHHLLSHQLTSCSSLTTSIKSPLWSSSGSPLC